MFPEVPLGRYDHVRVVQRPHRERLALRHTDDRDDAGPLRRGGERVDLRARHLDRLVVEPGVPDTGFGQRLHEHPVGEAGDEALRQRDDVGSASTRLLDQGHSLRRRRLSFESDGRLLHGRGAERRCGVEIHESLHF